MARDEDDEQREMRKFFKRLRKSPDVLRVGDVYVDIPWTVHRRVACADGLCFKTALAQGKKLRGRSCCTTFAVPVTTEDVERVACVVGEVRKTRDVSAAIDHAEGWWEVDENQLWLKQRDNGACVFLSAPAGGAPLCTIHEWAVNTGRDFRDHKPEGCCLYPLYTVEWGEEVLVTSYGSPFMLEMEPDQEGEIQSFACTNPPDGVGVSILVEQREELEYRVGLEPWSRVRAALARRGHEV